MKHLKCGNIIFSESKVFPDRYFCWVCHEYVIPLTNSEYKKVIEEIEQ